MYGFTRDLRNCMILVTLGLTGCAQKEEAPPALTWQGETPHLMVAGRLNGEEVAIEVSGEEVANGSVAWCKREYEAPTREDGTLDLAAARSTATEVAGLAVVNDEERLFELEIRQRAIQSEDVGAVISVVPNVTAANEARVDWEWHLGDVDLYEASAQEGHLQFELFTGTPGEGGVVIPSGEGSIGGTIDARWSLDDSLRVSFTVPCMETEVEAL